MVKLCVMQPHTVHLEVSPAVAVLPGGAPYEGPYELTPTREQQVLHTEGHSMAQDVVVHPIPPNYGLITHNGYELTVS